MLLLALLADSRRDHDSHPCHRPRRSSGVHADRPLYAKGEGAGGGDSQGVRWLVRFCEVSWLLAGGAHVGRGKFLLNRAAPKPTRATDLNVVNGHTTARHVGGFGGFAFYYCLLLLSEKTFGCTGITPPLYD